MFLDTVIKFIKTRDLQHMSFIEVNALPQRQRGPRLRAGRPGGMAPSRGIQQARRKPLPPVPRRRGNKPLPKLPGTPSQRKPRRRNPGGSGPRNPMGKGFPTGNYPRGTRWCRVEEDEYIADIAGSTGFATTAFPVNPGQVTTFPWLSKQAAQWEKYHWEYLEFYYKPEVSAFAANGATGKVILSMDYDASDAPPSSKQQAEDTDPHTDAMPYEDLLLALDPRQMFEMADSKYVRPGGLPGSSDIKTYDSGNLSVSTIANSSAALIGELHVRYAVIFEVPVLETAPGGSVAINNQVALFVNGSQAGVSGAANTLLLAISAANGIGAVNTAGSIVVPGGNYLVDFVGVATAATNMTSNILSLDVAAVAVTTTARIVAATALLTEDTLSGSWYLALNGTTAISLVSTITGTGAVASSGLLRITAI